MLKNLSQLECVIAEKTYRLTCDNDSPLLHVKEAISIFNNYVDQVEAAVKNTQEEMADKLKKQKDDLSNTNMPIDQKLAFDTELSIAASTFTGSAQLVGVLTNEPVILIIKNQTSVPVFIADNSGSTKGTTMIVGETILLNCRANAGKLASLRVSWVHHFFT